MMIEIAEKNDINDIDIDTTKKFKIRITESLIEDFAKISGDYNPLHMNEDYAKTTKFEKRISHGMLLASFFSRLVGMYIPGEKSLYLSQSLKFVNPCYIDDEITVEGHVISISTSTKIITLSVIIKNDSGIILVKGETKVMVR